LFDIAFEGDHGAQLCDDKILDIGYDGLVLGLGELEDMG
jgi:hypothetical protein